MRRTGQVRRRMTFFGGGYKFMVAVGSRLNQFKVKNRVRRCRCVPDGGGRT